MNEQAEATGEWPPSGQTAALEPDTLPERPLRAQDCEALIAKEIG